MNKIIRVCSEKNDKLENFALTKGVIAIVFNDEANFAYGYGLKNQGGNEWGYFHIIGSTVIGSDGTRYGVVREIVQTGANDVFVVDTGEKELLIPALKNVVRKVDVLKKTIIIDYTLYDQ